VAALLAQAFCVVTRWKAKLAPVFAAELRRALAPDAVADRGDVVPSSHQQQA
jgi:hypothetical protein